ncbi:MAG: hypothetical protein K6T83_10280 [Alicyclobacillus sp.]|nr:hypothetical protein [Alicyclobacillus sp.]
MGAAFARGLNRELYMRCLRSCWRFPEVVLRGEGTVVREWVEVTEQGLAAHDRLEEYLCAGQIKDRLRQLCQMTVVFHDPAIALSLAQRAVDENRVCRTHFLISLRIPFM